MVDKQPKDINDFWMKVLSLMLAIMVWFIIKTAQDLPYTNRVWPRCGPAVLCDQMTAPLASVMARMFLP